MELYGSFETLDWLETWISTMLSNCSPQFEICSQTLWLKSSLTDTFRAVTVSWIPFWGFTQYKISSLPFYRPVSVMVWWYSCQFYLKLLNGSWKHNHRSFKFTDHLHPSANWLKWLFMYFRQQKRLKQADEKQMELVRREKGFTLYVNGANAALTHANQVEAGVKTTRTARPKTCRNKFPGFAGLEGKTWKIFWIGFICYWKIWRCLEKLQAFGSPEILHIVIFVSRVGCIKICRAVCLSAICIGHEMLFYFFFLFSVQEHVSLIKLIMWLKFRTFIVRSYLALLPVNVVCNMFAIYLSLVANFSLCRERSHWIFCFCYSWSVLTFTLM